VVNETTGFSPFELLFGRSVKGPSTLIKNAMLQETDLSRSKKNVVEFMLDTRERLRTGLELATTHATEQRSKAKVWYDRKARMQEFNLGDCQRPSPGLTGFTVAVARLVDGRRSSTGL
jgi:hypothetical protein